MIYANVEQSNEYINIKFGKIKLEKVQKLPDEAIKTQEVINNRDIFKIIDRNSGSIYLLNKDNLCNSYRSCYVKEQLNNDEIIERIVSDVRNSGFLQDPSSFQVNFPSIPKRITSQLDRYSQHIKIGKTLYPDSIIAIIGKISILTMDKNAKLEFIEKILAEFDPTGTLRAGAQKIIEDIANDTWENSGTTPLSEPAKKVLLEVEKFIENMADGWSKERLKRFVNDIRSQGHEYAYNSYERALEQSHFFGGLLSFSEFLKKTNSSAISDYSLNSIFQIALSSTYEKLDMGSKNIMISGEVSSDGVGDYFHMWQSAKIVKDGLPDSSVSVAVHCQSAPQVSKESAKVENLVYSSEEEYQSKQVEKRLKEADVIVNISHGYARNPGKIPVIRVEEYGVNPKSDGYAFGITSALNTQIIGLPMADVSRAEGIEELSTPSLREHLMLKGRPFFLGYLKKDQVLQEQARCGFVLAAAASQKGQKEDMDIVCAFENLSQLDTIALKGSNIGKVVLMTRDKEGKLQETDTLDLGQPGKEIRILNPFPIPNDDMKILLKFCQPLVGCTGDVSITEVISNGKIPFYQIRWHKGDFFNNLYHFARAEGLTRVCEYLDICGVALNEHDKELESSDFSQYCLQMGDKCISECIEEFEKLTDRLASYSTRNSLLVDCIKRFFVHKDHPELEQVENEAKMKWLSGEISLSEACDLVKNSHR